MSEPLTLESLAARVEAVEDEQRTLHAAFDCTLIEANDACSKMVAHTEDGDRILNAMMVLLSRLTKMTTGKE
jgi:hypothetical protein